MLKGLAALAVLLAATSAAGAAAPGETAPDFTLADTDGKAVHLADFRGKVVVLEWTNHECPFVRAHYDSGVMQRLQLRARAAGAVWFSIVSSARGREGHVDGPEGNRITRADKAEPTAKLLDPTGKVGRLYGAKVTPHMYVIDRQGIIAYNGAIDDRDTWRSDEAKAAGGNLVAAALRATVDGKKVAQPSTVPYGCTVKSAH
jgi:peroxiredoxin